ncbi:MAG: hypothetical protein ACJZ14_01075 [Candidatus Neomarinimicrobiota bacterium]
MNYKNEKNQLDGIEKIVDTTWLGTGGNNWEDICVVLDEWVEMNIDNPQVKEIIMDDCGFDTDEDYQDLIDDTYGEFYEWFCDNTETNRIMYLNSQI